MNIVYRSANLFVRLLSMAAKFILVVYIGKYLDTESLGQYGLFSTTIALIIMLIGFDFYTYSTRLIVCSETDKRPEQIKNQFIFHFLSYLLSFPFVYLIFKFDVLDSGFLLIFYLIMVCEHLSQEQYRLFTALSRPILANVLLFFRSGMWVYLLMFLWHMEVNSSYSLHFVYNFWFVGSVLSVIIGFYYMFRMFPGVKLSRTVDWIWIKKGLAVSMSFFVGTIAYKIIEVSNRYIIDYYYDKTYVGIFTLFSGIANAMQVVVFTLVIMVYYPRLIEINRDKDHKLFSATVRKFYTEVIFVSMLIIAALAVFIKPVLFYLHKPEFDSNISVLWVLLASVFMLNLSFVPHYILYVKNRDKIIRNTTLIGALINILLNLILIPLYSLNGAAVAGLVSFIFMYGIKHYYVLRHMEN